MSTVGLLRTLVLLLLGAAVLLPHPAPRRAARAALWLREPIGAASGTSLLARPAPGVVARSTPTAPSEAELEFLEAMSLRAPVLAAAPEAPNLVEVEPPFSPRAGRAAALGFRVTGRPGDRTLVRLGDAAGPLDSVGVRLDRWGFGAGSFRVRPPRPGWREWTVAAAGARATTGAWVDSGGPPRVLIHAGFPEWETRFVVRALEESGAAVSVAYPLGRGLSVAGGGPSLSAGALAGVDVAVVMESATTSPEERSLLDAFAARGGGVLLVGGHAARGALGLVRSVNDVRAIEAGALVWSLPGELAALPPAEIRSDAVALGAPLPGATAVATASGAGVLVLRPVGRGRAAALALTETWRWRMEGGQVAEHREFWRGLVDWLGSAPAENAAPRTARPTGVVGVPVDVEVFAPAAAAASWLRITRPGGAADSVALTADPDRVGVVRGTFVPTAVGLHLLDLEANGARSAFRSTAAAEARADAWPRLAAIAHRSGGAFVPRASLSAEVERRLERRGGERSSGGPGMRLAAAVLALLVAVAEWSLRRFRGMS